LRTAWLQLCIDAADVALEARVDPFNADGLIEASGPAYAQFERVSSQEY
jgi:hypothetical protein